jgi:nucleoside-diphosphate-sugar epimerase
MSVLKFAEAILVLTGSRSQIAFRNLPVDDPKVRRPDISLARNLLNWQPEVRLEEGLRKSLDYFQQNMERIRKGKPKDG